MINVNISGVGERIEENKKEYRIVMSINALDDASILYLKKIDKILNALYGEDNKYSKKSKEVIEKVDSYDDGVCYFLPFDIDFLVEILKLFAYGRGINAFLDEELITPEQFSISNRKNLYHHLAEFIKISILKFKESEKEEPLTLGKFLEEFSRKFFG